MSQLSGMSSFGRAQAVKSSYYPRSWTMSPSLKRARAPYKVVNAIVGLSLATFAIGIYSYSISAVRQDDFSDVEDLLPPAEVRQQLRSIEDEQREQGTTPSFVPAPTSQGPSGMAFALPGQGMAGESGPGTGMGMGNELDLLKQRGLKGSVPGRLAEADWVKGKGLVEEATGNVLVWGAPSVDRVGYVWDKTDQKGRRVV